MNFTELLVNVTEFFNLVVTLSVKYGIEADEY